MVERAQGDADERERQLTNFTAHIVGELEEDDGIETNLSFQIYAKAEEREKCFRISPQGFEAMTWPMEQLGARAVLLPGPGVKDHVRAAIQLLSGAPLRTRAYKHTGWREITPGEWAYLHGGGAIGLAETTGPAGATVPISEASARSTLPVMHLANDLAKFVLPEPPTIEASRIAIQASLALLRLGPEVVCYPLFAAIWRAACGFQVPDFSIHLAGPSGVFKSELAALAQQHFGAGMNARNLPGTWSSTENALEAIAFAAKDALLVIDDYVPSGPSREVQRLHLRSDRVLRAQGNNSGRQRMRADGSLRPTRMPRGLIISTGEDTPPGQSLRGRMLILEITKGDIPVDRLTLCQKDAANGLYAQALSAFLSWLAPRWEEERSNWRARVERIRDEIMNRNYNTQHQHRRTPEIASNLGGGWMLFLQFARDAGVLSYGEVEDLGHRGLAALMQVANQQVHQQAVSEPAIRFGELLAAALASGKAHVANTRGGRPSNALAWGWRTATSLEVLDEVRAESSGNRHMDWQPQGTRIGWVDEASEALYLIPDSAYNVARRLGEEGGEGLTVTSHTLWKRLRDKGILLSVDRARETLTIRRVLEGTQRQVLHLDAASPIWENPDTSDIPSVEDADLLKHNEA
ncbi:MAG TPA: DUF927 domain-containing protein [Chloroflexia bacterium]|nr:DUF927 domain-containing protein [Chloroflexia bacterium]